MRASLTGRRLLLFLLALGWLLPARADAAAAPAAAESQAPPAPRRVYALTVEVLAVAPELPRELFDPDGTLRPAGLATLERATDRDEAELLLSLSATAADGLETALSVFDQERFLTRYVAGARLAEPRVEPAEGGLRLLLQATSTGREDGEPRVRVRLQAKGSLLQRPVEATQTPAGPLQAPRRLTLDWDQRAVVRPGVVHGRLGAVWRGRRLVHLLSARPLPAPGRARPAGATVTLCAVPEPALAAPRREPGYPLLSREGLARLQAQSVALLTIGATPEEPVTLHPRVEAQQSYVSGYTSHPPAAPTGDADGPRAPGGDPARFVVPQTESVRSGAEVALWRPEATLLSSERAPYQVDAVRSLLPDGAFPRLSTPAGPVELPRVWGFGLQGVAGIAPGEALVLADHDPALLRDAAPDWLPAALRRRRADAAPKDSAATTSKSKLPEAPPRIRILWILTGAPLPAVEETPEPIREPIRW
jgi:hypothetical protein